MTAHISSCVLNLSVYPIDRSVEMSYMYSVERWDFAISEGTFSVDGGSAARG